MAGGFTLDEEHFHSFHQCIQESLKDIELYSSSSVIQIDEMDLSVANIQSLSALEPFGMGNEEPLYLLKNVPVSKVYTLSDGKHLKMDIEYKNVKLFGLFFNHGEKAEEIKQQQNVDLIGTLSINEYRNQKSINIIIKDMI